MVRLGSKVDTESVILAEMATQLARMTGATVEHHSQLGGTRVLWSALVRGEIDVYPEYTGTIVQEILGGQELGTTDAIGEALQRQGIRMSLPLGFNNTYAIGMKAETANRLNIRTISDLARHPELKFGFSDEFMNRKDGWPGLRQRYGLSPGSVRNLNHDLSYRGLNGGALDVIDLYSTDAEIQYYQLVALADDLRYFPPYEAVFLYREDFNGRAPHVMTAIRRLEGQVLPAAIIAMNARSKLDKTPEARVAADGLSDILGIRVESTQETAARRLVRNAGDHLYLVVVSLSAAILIALPLGVWAAKRPRFGQVVLAVAGVIQTIPSLALLVLLIPLLGIGEPPAVVALFLYGLLPIIRNTYTGLHDIPPPLLESAAALGLPPAARLRLVELPLASRAILGGIKTSAVINVGTATLGAVIGAGGFGQPILTGIRLDNVPLILEGAVPAAVLALVVQGAFELIERAVVPRGLRLNR